MKQVFSLCMICFWAISAMAQCATVPVGYVNLGLPSGTLWKLHNEAKFYTYEEAMVIILKLFLNYNTLTISKLNLLLV